MTTVGLLTGAAMSITTVVVTAVSRAQYAAKRGVKPHELPELQSSQALLKGVLAGLSAGVLVAILELSLTNW